MTITSNPTIAPLSVTPRERRAIQDPPGVNVLGVRFHCLTLETSLDRIHDIIQEGMPHHIVLANAYTVALCHRSPTLKDLLNRANLVLADGMSIVWGARWIGVSLPERVAGPDLMEALCAISERRNYRIFLMGSYSENLDALQRTLLLRWPGLTIVGYYSPPMCERFEESETQLIVDRLRETKPDILFTGISAPKQEIWIAENLGRLQVPVAMGVGAAFDFLSGRIPRAPLWMQKIGLEWLYRLWREPRRLWRRYVLGNLIFLSLLLKELVSYKVSRLRVFRF